MITAEEAAKVDEAKHIPVDFALKQISDGILSRASMQVRNMTATLYCLPCVGGVVAGLVKAGFKVEEHEMGMDTHGPHVKIDITW